MFWCGPALVKQMIAFAKSCQGLYETETCIYGDFLACMGTRPAEEKLYWQEISVASQLKRNIASHFQATHLEILVLEQSCFYHLGTMSECAFFRILPLYIIRDLRCAFSPFLYRCGKFATFCFPVQDSWHEILCWLPGPPVLNELKWNCHQFHRQSSSRAQR